MNRDERQIFVGEFPRNSASTIKAHLVPWKRAVYCDVRIFEKRPDGDEHPDVRGIRFDVELIPQFIRLLEQVQEAAPEQQLKLAALGGGNNGGDPDAAMQEKVLAETYAGGKVFGRRHRW